MNFPVRNRTESQFPITNSDARIIAAIRHSVPASDDYSLHGLKAKCFIMPLRKQRRIVSGKFVIENPGTVLPKQISGRVRSGRFLGGCWIFVLGKLLVNE
jgi:hypothetical protein